MKTTLLLVLTFLFINAGSVLLAQEPSQEVGVTTTTETPADSLRDSVTSSPDNTKYIPPAPGSFLSVVLTANGWVWLEYFYYEYYASMLWDYMDPLVSFLGTADSYKNGKMKLAEYGDLVGWVFKPKISRRFSTNAKFTLCFKISDALDIWIPDYGIDNKIMLTTDVVDNGIKGHNYKIYPQEIDESLFKFVGIDRLEEYQKTRQKSGE